MITTGARDNRQGGAKTYDGGVRGTSMQGYKMAGGPRRARERNVAMYVSRVNPELTTTACAAPVVTSSTASNGARYAAVTHDGRRASS